jgi:3-hydroxyacyl-CoA dehydrogenase
VRIERAAVLGAGVMGAAIAAHLANVGIPTLLLDLPAKDGEDSSAPARAGLKRATKSKPASFSSKRAPALVEVGNLQDDLARLAECDWVVEAIIENLEIKRSLYEKVAPHMAPHAVLASNTSGLSAQALSDALPPELRPRFLVTHFFNPPRYLKLLEIVRGPEPDDAVVALFEDFGLHRRGGRQTHRQGHRPSQERDVPHGRPRGARYARPCRGQPLRAADGRPAS